MTLHRQVRALESGAALLDAAQPFGERQIEGLARRRDHELQTRHIGNQIFRDPEIPAVGNQCNVIARDHHAGCGCEQAGEVGDVGERGHQQGVEPGCAHVLADPRVTRKAQMCGSGVHQADGR